jgi:hypothetical protein
VRFGVHPHQHRTDVELHCIADLVDEREVTTSSGHSELRMIIRTGIVIGARRFSTQLTLTDRDTMRFRMLLGRSALRDRFLVDPRRSFAEGEPQGPTRLRPSRS